MAEELGVDTRREASADPAKNLRRWLLEIKIAEKREKKWRETGNKVLDAYRGTKRKRNSFNILWANTEVMRPALYNSQPKPDVRRRFRQKDILGKACAEIMERSLSYCVDAYDMDSCIRNDVLDALLPGRGLSRVRYIPRIVQAGEETGREPAEAFQGTHEEVEYEQALCDHVQWDDFIHGAGKTWQEVPWVGFKHRLTKDDYIEKFGKEVGRKVTLDDVNEEALEGKQENEKEAFKRAVFWEIWDKDDETVFFVNESYKDSVIYPIGSTGEPPLKFKNFFPCPMPLMMVEDTGTLIPTPLYEQYREQAEELDRVSARINNVTNACKARFVYDAVLSELKTLMDGGDNIGVPSESARTWMANGGLEKAIWWMPIEQLAKVLKELHLARDMCKQVIYEITGIADVMRGQTDPNETLGAQKLKANSASLRLQRMQREVQRYVRDLVRLLAEIVGEHFDPQTLAKMTGLQFPTEQQKQELQLQLQAAQQQMPPPMPGQPPPQMPPDLQQKLQQAQQVMEMPSWEDIKAVISDDMAREYRIDIETDSTVAESLAQDQEGMKEVLTGVAEFTTAMGPAIMSGGVSIEAFKAMLMSYVRRARMGLEVEDALESGVQQPQPQADPKVAADAAKLKLEEQKALHEGQLKDKQAVHDAQMDAAEARRKEQESAAKIELERQKADDKIELEREKAGAQALIERERMAHDAAIADKDRESNEFNKIRELDSSERVAQHEVQAGKETAAETATIKADASKETAKITSAAKAEGEGKAKPKSKEDDTAALQKLIKDLMEEANAPIRLIKGADGRTASVIKGKRTMKITRTADGVTIQ